VLWRPLGGVGLLIFERVATVPDSDVALYVFIDSEKGHTVYLANTGTMNVVDQAKSRNSSARAAGFMSDDHNCIDCNGC
jgi:hypothetical protein